MLTSPASATTLAAGVSHPHLGAGVTLVALALVAAAGGGLLLRLKRTSSLLGELAAVSVVLLLAGLVLMTRTQTRPAAAALPAPTQPPLPSPVETVPALPFEVAPSALPSATAPASATTAAASASPVASRSASPRPTARVSARPTPTAAPTFTATVVRPATCNTVKGGSVEREAVVLLRNSSRAPVAWHGAARERANKPAPAGTPWAVVDPTGTTILPGKTLTVGVRPYVSMCRTGTAASTRHVDVTYGRSALVVDLTVVPQP
jgi:pyruvate/2-oxoglutarate dehydrogenase complex dihydrolipoamide acyltransferase (E2) component